MKFTTNHYAKYLYIDERRHHGHQRQEVIHRTKSQNLDDLIVPEKTCYRIETYDKVSTSAIYQGKEISLHSDQLSYKFYCIGKAISLEEISKNRDKYPAYIYESIAEHPELYVGAFEDVTGRLHLLSKFDTLLSPEDLTYKKHDDENE